MNIRLKAGLEVSSFVVGVITLAILTRLGLDYLASIVGPEELAKGLMLSFILAVFLGTLKLLFDIRVSQLKYKEKLEEITKK